MPDYETRKIILRGKIYKDGIDINNAIIDCIASKITTNIRELEGTLVSLLAQATLNKKAITLELAETMIDKLVNSTQHELTVAEIQKVVCNYFCIPPENLLSKTRKREIVQARQIAMYFSRSMTKSSLSSIGAQIGGKDHATVLHSYNTVCDLIDTDKHFKQHVQAIEKKLKSTL
jgi:chromosomal replication initiator protein